MNKLSVKLYAINYEAETSLHMDEHLEEVRHLVEHGVLVELTTIRQQIQEVAGQNDDGSFNGKDYVEERWVSDWTFIRSTNIDP